MPDTQNLGRAFQQFVLTGDFDFALWPFIPKATTLALFTSIRAGGTPFYHDFLGEVPDPTQFFREISTSPITPPISPPIGPDPLPPTFVALVLEEVGFVPSFAPGQTWDFFAIIWAFPDVDLPFSVRVERVAGITTVPGATFNATFRITFAEPLLPPFEETQGWFLELT